MATISLAILASILVVRMSAGVAKATNARANPEETKNEQTASKGSPFVTSKKNFYLYIRTAQQVLMLRKRRYYERSRWHSFDAPLAQNN